jgi:glycopeptide antibiotics resistance protein
MPPPGGRPRRLHPLTLLAFLWGAFVLYGTTIPFDFSADPATVDQGWRELRSSAHRLVHLLRPSWSDIVSNLLLFFPWSALLAARGRLAGRGLALAALVAIGTGASFSVAVEYLQIYARSRYASVWDVTLNVVGAAAGFVAGWLAPAVYRRVAPRIAAAAASRPLTVLSAAVALLGWFSALAPYELSLDVGSLRHEVRLARVIPFGPTIGHETVITDPLLCGAEVAAALVLGGLFSLALREWGRSGWARILGAGAAVGGLSVFMEACQLFVVGRRTDLTSSALYMAGGLMGAGIVALAPRKTPAQWAGPALAGWAISTLFEYTAPLSFGMPSRAELARALWIPFLGYFRRMDMTAVSDLLLQTLNFVPMGALLAFLKPALKLGHIVAAGFAAGAAFEALQLFNPYRTSDSTDAVLAALGAGVGYVLYVVGSSRIRRAAAQVQARPGGRTPQDPGRGTHDPGTASADSR